MTSSNQPTKTSREHKESSKKRLFNCASCYKKIYTKKDLFKHPILGTIQCSACNQGYKLAGDLSKYINGVDLEGKDNFCRWCLDGGDLLLCTENRCHHGFCKTCIENNLGSERLDDINNDPSWYCFVCDDAQLEGLREIADKAFKIIKPVVPKNTSSKKASPTPKKKSPPPPPPPPPTPPVQRLTVKFFSNPTEVKRSQLDTQAAEAAPSTPISREKSPPHEPIIPSPAPIVSPPVSIVSPPAPSVPAPPLVCPPPAEPRPLPISFNIFSSSKMFWKPKETPKESPKESPKKIPEETLKVTPRETPSESHKKVPTETPSETHKETPINTIKETPLTETHKENLTGSKDPPANDAIEDLEKELYISDDSSSETDNFLEASEYLGDNTPMDIDPVEEDKSHSLVDFAMSDAIMFRKRFKVHLDTLIETYKSFDERRLKSNPDDLASWLSNAELFLRRGPIVADRADYIYELLRVAKGNDGNQDEEIDVEL